MKNTCDACGCPDVEVKEFPAPPFKVRKDPFMLCTLCSRTMSGNAAMYPDQYRDKGVVLQTICHVGNEILRAIKQLEKS